MTRSGGLVLLERLPKETPEIPGSSTGHRPRLQLVAGIVDAGSPDCFRKLLPAFSLVGKGHSRACPHLVALVDLSQRSHGHAVVDAAKD
jgi:hypothetical protein